MTQPQNQEIELNRLLSYVLETDASDLHFVVGKPPMVRIDSLLTPVRDYPVCDEEQIGKLLEVMLTEALSLRLQADRQVDFSYAFKGNTRFRANVYYQKGTLAASLRHIPSKIRSLEELNIYARVGDFARARQGLVLAVGPTGHGKSTTLAALIDQINHSRPDHVITIEDPIEYIYIQDQAIISQREVHQDAKSFVQAIRATLREDPNVVMIGEMRDLESIAAALTVAETGHLVLATLHTNDAPQTMDRIIDVFPAHQQNQIRSQLASVLLGVVSQRLLPRVGGGRVPAVELMFANNAVRNVIREGRVYELYNIIHTSSNEGMVSLERSLAELVTRGLVKLEDALLYANDQELFKSLVKRF